jgi:hypothetical protein
MGGVVDLTTATSYATRWPQSKPEGNRVEGTTWLGIGHGQHYYHEQTVRAYYY